MALEKNCGRPLGLRVRDGYIYVVDAYLGLFKVNIKTGNIIIIIIIIISVVLIRTLPTTIFIVAISMVGHV